MDIEQELLVVAYIKWRTDMEALDNDGLARAILEKSPPFGKLGELCEIAAERLSPGIVERMYAEEQAKPAGPATEQGKVK